ncbi:hypothetical protein ACO2RV_15140 [Ancylobacter sp. VNQ12]|uniref:hypothetical protein n=1 Tax=Ancylobacter sp. VNQ12 TaxID=3400920 RepID=UPI003C08EFDA
MPLFDADELRGLIAEGGIVGFTLDTNLIDGLNNNGNLDNRILLSLENLKAKQVAKDGQGCAIGFSREMFKTDSDDLQPVEKRVFVGRVRYPGRRLPPRFRDPMAVTRRR